MPALTAKPEPIPIPRGSERQTKSLCASSGRCSGGRRSALRKEHEHGVRQRREAGGLGVCRRTRCHARFCVAQFSSIEDRCWHDNGDDKGREERQTNREIGDGEEASRRNRLVRGNVAPYTADVRWLTGQGGEGISFTTLHGAHMIVHTFTTTHSSHSWRPGPFGEISPWLAMLTGCPDQHNGRRSAYSSTNSWASNRFNLYERSVQLTLHERLRAFDLRVSHSPCLR